LELVFKFQTWQGGVRYM